MKKIYLLFPIIILLLFGTSCGYFRTRRDTIVFYTVKSNTLNVRQSPSSSAKILGKIHKGDTIYPTRIIFEQNWIRFKYEGGYAFVNYKYLDEHVVADLSKVSNMKFGKTATFILDNIDKYLNWRTWKFWAIAISILVILAILLRINKAIDNAVYWRYQKTGSARLPYFSVIIGALYSLAYMFWHEDVLQAFFVNKFWWLPEGEDWIPWYLWSVTVVGIVGLFFFWIFDIIKYRARGIYRIIYYTIAAIVGFVGGLFLGAASLVLVIGYIIISILPESSTTSGSKNYGSESGEPTSWEKTNRFYREKKEREEKEERRAIDDFKKDAGIY
jgi:hypothetical protein